MIGYLPRAFASLEFAIGDRTSATFKIRVRPGNSSGPYDGMDHPGHDEDSSGDGHDSAPDHPAGEGAAQAQGGPRSPRGHGAAAGSKRAQQVGEVLQ